MNKKRGKGHGSEHDRQEHDGRIRSEHHISEHDRQEHDGRIRSEHSISGRIRSEHSISGRIRRAYGVLVAAHYTTIAGTLVFFLITSIVPFVFWLTLLFGESNVAVEEIARLELFGWAKDLLLFLRDNAQGASRGASAFFLATTLWSSSGFFYHLRRSGEIVYGCRHAQTGWRVRISALVLTFAVLFFFAVAGAILFAVVYSLRFLSPWIGYPAVYLMLLVVGFFAAWMLNGYVCPYRISPSDTATGSGLTALLWLIASAAFSVYLRFSDRERLYGALSLIIVFLLWLYWMMICFTVGMVYSSRRAGVRGRIRKRL